jgi:hypothetical protein
LTDSILDTVKKTIGIDPENTAFDIDITTALNSVLTILHQLGVETGITRVNDNSSTWTELIPEKYDLDTVKSYVCLRVRMLFDPPTSSGISTAIQEQIKELEWRINFEVDPHTAQEITTGGAEPP